MQAWKLAIVLVALGLVACVDPADRRPGLRLSGDVVEDAVADWSFTDEHPEIWIETRTVYWVPHSVTIVCATNGERLFVAAREPEGKRWVANVERDPNVRLQIGESVYERKLRRLDAADAETAYAAYASKYGWDPVPADQRPPFFYWEVVERG